MTTLNRKYIRPTTWRPRKSQRELHAYFTNLSVNDIYCQPNYKLAEHLGVSIQTAAERVRNHAAIGACKILRELDAKGRIVFSSKGRKPVTRIQLFPEDKWHEPTTKHPRRSPIRALRTMQESLHGSPTMKESLHGLSSSKDKDLSISDGAAMQESLHHNTSISSVKESVYIGSVSSAVCSVMEESLHGSVRNRQESAAPTLQDTPSHPPDIGPDPVVELLRKSGAKYMGVPPKPTQSDIRQQIADLQAKLAHYIAADQRSAIAGFPNAWTRYVEETWGEIARLEKEQYGHVETKRELNAQNPKLYNENGGYKHGLSYPCTIDEDGVSQYDPDLVLDCSVCRVEGCWVTTSESGDRFTVGFTCGSPACDETREKMLRGQKEFDERVSEDETLTTKEEAAL